MKLVAALSFFLGLASAAVEPATPVSYNGYKVVRLAVGNNVSRVTNIINKLGLTTWKGAPRAGVYSDIVIPPEQIEAFEAETADLDTTVMHEDLAVSIAEESPAVFAAAAGANYTWFNSYHAYADHLQFLNDLQASYPQNSEIVQAGNSLNGNPITGIHLYGSSGKGVKPAVVFYGTVHAREWVTTLTTEFFAYTLLTNYSSSAEVKAYVDKYDFYIFPVTNPDGFLYTQTTDRLWRKNRQSTAGSSCLGHDINRNWPYKWNLPGGASDQPCDQDFRGLSEGDAPETKVLSAFVNKIKSAQGLKLFIDWHSYSQLFMTPYGYSCDAVAANNAELQTLARGAVAAIKAVHGTSFEYGPICTTIYQATGSSVDYVADVVKADYTFTAELRDTGRYGFVLPANQIIPTAEETWAGVKYLLANMK